MWMPILLVGGCMGMILFLCFLLQSERVIYSNQAVKFFFFVVALALALFGTSAKPMTDWDSYRHFLHMDDIRESGISFIDFMFYNENGVGGKQYVDLYGFNCVRYIAVLIGDNRWLVFILTFLTYCNWAYISCDFIVQHSVCKNRVLIAALLCFTFLPFIYVPSGLRNATAASIAAIAVYGYFMKHKKLIYTLLGIALACTFHSSMIMVVPIFLLSLFKQKKMIVISLILLSASMNVWINMAQESGVSFLENLAKQYLTYTSENQYTFSVGYLAMDIIGLLLLVYNAFSTDSFREISCCIDIRTRRLVWFLCLYAMFILCQVGNYDLVLRPCYLLAMLSMPITFVCIDLRPNENVKYKHLLLFIFGVLGILVSVYEHAYSFIYTTYLW